VIESPVTAYEIKRAEFAIILEEDNQKKQRVQEAFLEEMWKDMLKRYSDDS